MAIEQKYLDQAANDLFFAYDDSFGYAGLPRPTTTYDSVLARAAKEGSTSQSKAVSLMQEYAALLQKEANDPNTPTGPTSYELKEVDIYGVKYYVLKDDPNPHVAFRVDIPGKLIIGNAIPGSGPDDGYALNNNADLINNYLNNSAIEERDKKVVAQLMGIRRPTEADIFRAETIRSYGGLTPGAAEEFDQNFFNPAAGITEGVQERHDEKFAWWKEATNMENAQSEEELPLYAQYDLKIFDLNNKIELWKSRPDAFSIEEINADLQEMKRLQGLYAATPKPDVFKDEAFNYAATAGSSSGGSSPAPTETNPNTDTTENPKDSTADGNVQTTISNNSVTEDDTLTGGVKPDNQTGSTSDSESGPEKSATPATPATPAVPSSNSSGNSNSNSSADESTPSRRDKSTSNSHKGAAAASNTDVAEDSNASIAGGTYTVKKGDTLSEIAQAHGMDYHTLAKINGIADSHWIHPGQQIRFSDSASGGLGGSTGDNTLPSGEIGMVQYTDRQ